jgi:membrane-associated phospholipid phosphatase
MPRRAPFALLGALAGVVLLLLTWYAAFHIGFLERADGRILSGFSGISRPRVDSITNRIATLCNPKPYVVLAAIPVIVAVWRGRLERAVAIFGILIGANLTTQLLKPVLAQTRITTQVAGNAHVASASWPSGHATAAMALALCAVLASPARYRPRVAAAGAAFAIVVSYSFLELGWHYPSDVLGGFLVAVTWTLLGAAAIFAYDRRRPHPVEAESEALPAPSLAMVLWPSAAIVLCGVVVVGLVALARPHEVLAYARDHTAFIVGAAAIGTLAIGLAAGITLLSGNEGRAGVHVPRPRPREHV